MDRHPQRSPPCPALLLPVCDEHSDYKDAKLLYRFRKDDGTFPLNKDVKVFVRGQSLYEKCVSPSLSRGSWRGLRSLLLLLCGRDLQPQQALLFLSCSPCCGVGK